MMNFEVLEFDITVVVFCLKQDTKITSWLN